MVNSFKFQCIYGLQFSVYVRNTWQWQDLSEHVTKLGAYFNSRFHKYNCCIKWNIYQTSHNVLVVQSKSTAVPVQDYYRPWGVQEFEPPQISRKSAIEGGKVVSPRHRPRLTPKEILLELISVGGWVDPGATVRPEVSHPWKIGWPSGI
jgi:hypothetical protein